MTQQTNTQKTGASVFDISGPLGDYREGLVEQALHELQGDNRIRGFKMTEHGNALDRAGVDAFFYTNTGKRIAFQIKGSPTGVRRHYERHPGIPCINVGECQTAHDVKKIILRTFRRPLPKMAKGRTDAEKRKLLDEVVFIPVASGARGYCGGSGGGHQCSQRAHLEVKGATPPIRCCKSRKCRVRAAELARRERDDRYDR